jgi:hypothetical protein
VSVVSVTFRHRDQAGLGTLEQVRIAIETGQAPAAMYALQVERTDVPGGQRWRKGSAPIDTTTCACERYDAQRCSPMIQLWARSISSPAAWV